MFLHGSVSLNAVFFSFLNCFFVNNFINNFLYFLWFEKEGRSLPYQPHPFTTSHIWGVVIVREGHIKMGAAHVYRGVVRGQGVGVGVVGEGEGRGRGGEGVRPSEGQRPSDARQFFRPAAEKTEYYFIGNLLA